MKTSGKLKIINGIILAMAIAVAGLEGMVTEQVQHLLAYPSAFVASFFLGVSPIITEGNEVLILLSNQTINVTSKCSAFGFACLLYAILIINIIKMVPKSRIIAGCILALPATYIMTIIVNGSRIICAYYLHMFGKIMLPLNFQAALHQGAGIAIFLSTLIAITLIFERIHCHGRKT